MLLAVAVVAGGCTLAPDVYVADAVQGATDADVAIIVSKSALPHAIDGVTLTHPDPNKYYATLRLLPGRRKITLYKWFLVSVLVMPQGYFEATATYDLDLDAGHVYELHADRTTGPGFRVAMWIKDVTTGEIVAGEELD